MISGATALPVKDQLVILHLSGVSFVGFNSMNISTVTADLARYFPILPKVHKVIFYFSKRNEFA